MKFSADIRSMKDCWTKYLSENSGDLRLFGWLAAAQPPPTTQKAGNSTIFGQVLITISDFVRRMKNESA